MARARNIKPGLFKNEVLGVADPLLTLLFQSLWTLADREGRLEDRPLRIKAETFPYRENLDVNGYLTELQRLGFIQRYLVGQMSLIQVINFSKHQTPHNTEKPSLLPSLEQGIVTDVANQEITVKSPLDFREKPIALPPDSLLLTPDSRLLITDSLNLIHDSLNLPDTPVGVARRKGPRAEKEKPVTAEAWQAYAGAYESRYGTPPVRNATVNSQMANFVTRIGIDESPGVAAWFVGHQNRFYVETGHSVGILARDAEKLRTEWANGRRLTATQAMQADKTATNASVFGKMIDEAKQMEISNAKY